MKYFTKPVHLVSACLVGLCTRYDAKYKLSTSCLNRLENSIYIPVCPEQLGGLPTPREAADLHGGDGHDVLSGKACVTTHSGIDVSKHFILGARQILKIAQEQHITSILLKKGSPSCGIQPRCGVTAAILIQNGFKLEEF